MISKDKKDLEIEKENLMNGPQKLEPGSVYSVLVNPETGEEEWVKNPTSKSIMYTSEQFKTWVDNKLIPDELGSFGVEQLKKEIKRSKSVKELKDRSPEKMMEWLNQNSTFDLKELEKKTELLDFLLDNKEALLKFLQQPNQIKNKPRKIRHSGHYIDRKLEYNNPDKDPSLFDFISSQTIKENISNSKIEITTKGIRLTPQQDKMIHSFYRILADKSETRDETSDRFYSGNEPYELIPYGTENQTAKSVILRCRPHEMYKEYFGKDDYSGKEIENAKAILNELNEIKFLIIYDRKRKIASGELRTDRIEIFASLINIVEYIEDMTDAEVESLNRGEEEVREKKGSLVIAFNPLLTDQINSKYIEYPTDINQRTMIAAGGHRKVTESMITLRDWMMRELSTKRSKCEINADKLPHILKLDKYVKNGRKSLIQKRIDDSFKVVKALGIVTSIDRTVGSMGQDKYVFCLNQEFE